MLRISRVLAALAIAAIGAAASADVVYKWVDGSGQVHYTDLPPRQGDARILGVYQQESGDVDEGDYGDDYAQEGGYEGGSPQAGSESPRTPEPAVSDAAMAAAAADAEKAKVVQCKEAQDRYQRSRYSEAVLWVNHLVAAFDALRAARNHNMPLRRDIELRVGGNLRAHNSEARIVLVRKF